MTTFAQSVGQWASESEERLTAVYRRSVELLAEDMTKTKPQGGRVPFLTGNLARSLLASTSGMPKTSNSPSSGGNVGAIAATLTLDKPVWLGYQAKYAMRRNFGYVGQDSLGRNINETGDHFVDGAIANWSQIVAKAVNEVKG